MDTRLKGNQVTQEIEGGYAPPPNGIPITDLSPEVQELIKNAGGGDAGNHIRIDDFEFHQSQGHWAIRSDTHQFTHDELYLINMQYGNQGGTWEGLAVFGLTNDGDYAYTHISGSNGTYELEYRIQDGEIHFDNAYSSGFYGHSVFRIGAHGGAGNGGEGKPFYRYDISGQCSGGGENGADYYKLSFSVLSKEKLFDIPSSNIIPYGNIKIALEAVGATYSEKAIPATGLFRWMQNNGTVPSFTGTIYAIWCDDYPQVRVARHDNNNIEIRNLNFTSNSFHATETIIPAGGGGAGIDDVNDLVSTTPNNRLEVRDDKLYVGPSYILPQTGIPISDLSPEARDKLEQEENTDAMTSFWQGSLVTLKPNENLMAMTGGLQYEVTFNGVPNSKDIDLQSHLILDSKLFDPVDELFGFNPGDTYSSLEWMFQEIHNYCEQYGPFDYDNYDDQNIYDYMTQIFEMLNIIDQINPRLMSLKMDFSYSVENSSNPVTVMPLGIYGSKGSNLMLIPHIKTVGSF